MNVTKGYMSTQIMDVALGIDRAAVIRVLGYGTPCKAELVSVVEESADAVDSFYPRDFFSNYNMMEALLAAASISSFVVLRDNSRPSDGFGWLNGTYLKGFADGHAYSPDDVEIWLDINEPSQDDTDNEYNNALRRHSALSVRNKASQYSHTSAAVVLLNKMLEADSDAMNLLLTYRVSCTAEFSRYSHIETRQDSEDTFSIDIIDVFNGIARACGHDIVGVSFLESGLIEKFFAV